MSADISLAPIWHVNQDKGPHRSFPLARAGSLVCHTYYPNPHRPLVKAAEPLGPTKLLGALLERTIINGLSTGRVLAITGRDVALTWNERRGMLILKAFTFPTIGRMIALYAYGWPMSQQDSVDVEEYLHQAADRLVLAIAG